MRFIFGFLFMWGCLFSDHSVVFVYMGAEVPQYVQTAVDQAARFNPDCPIYLIGNKHPMKRFHEHKQHPNVKIVNAESLPVSKNHRAFKLRSRLNRRWKNGFWYFTAERFFWIASLMESYDLKNVIHIESDNMVYANFGSMMPIFEQHYPHIGMVMDCEQRCIPSVVYFAGAEDAKTLCKHFLSEGRKTFDMFVLSGFRNKMGYPYVSELPIFTPEYMQNETIRSPSGKTTNRPEVFARNFEHFQSIFDGAAIGQYLGGCDPIHKNSKPGFINETALFNPSKCRFEWERDEQGRNVPYVIYRNARYRVNNLHIHCKRLEEFR